MDNERTILHVDLNNFYASVECLYNPDLNGKPVAVGGDAKRRHGIILAKNNEAKAFGVKTGETLWQARQKCPHLTVVPPHHDLYAKYSRMARSIYENYTEQVESFGMDECWLDVTHSKMLYGNGIKIANEIRERVKRELGITVSVGVSFNKVFAKLGSDLKKPDAVTEIPKHSFREIVWPLPVEYLLFVGRTTAKGLKTCGISTIGDLAHMPLDKLKYKFGKAGVMLFHYANGLDESPVTSIEDAHEIKSIGNSTTLPRDLNNEEEIKIPMYALCEQVAERMRRHGLKCTTVQLSLKDNQLMQTERQAPLICATNSAQILFEKAWELYCENNAAKIPIRSIGVRAVKLTSYDGAQLSLLPELEKVRACEAKECVLDSIRHQYGAHAIRRGIMLTDESLADIKQGGAASLHPETLIDTEK